MSELTNNLQSQGKIFDADKYPKDIRLIIPGYEVMHSLIAPLILANFRKEKVNILVVGCGTGEELVNLAGTSSRWRVDALDTSASMCRSAKVRISLSGYENRIFIRNCSLQESQAAIQYDAAVCLLVSHFLPDDGERLDFYRHLRKRLRKGALLLIAEIFKPEPFGDLRMPAHLEWSKARGVTGARAAKLAARLQGSNGLHLIAENRADKLCQAAGFAKRMDFFRACSVVGSILIASEGGIHA